ncbi:GNAT family N-acetyltransferase [Spongiimicrobium sp. 2-473A-2-J]|uniref:GNAT family N-acetyltransferase n=1 Tax=Eudoraea algarum TaxID=3417568 RepID=UPI003D35A949
MNLVKENITNLTSLWRLVNQRTEVYKPGETYDHGLVNYSNWPNRLWFHGDPDLKSINEARAIIASASTKMTIPYWDIYQNESYRLLEEAGFVKVLDQVGMSLELPKTYPLEVEIELQKVDNRASALRWEALFEKAFNYTISHRLLLKTCDTVDYLIAFHEGKAVGTVVLHYTRGAVVGIHSMGVIPEMRRKGYAEKMMHAVLSQAVGEAFAHATLQASAMGKGLYLKLGFKDQFLMSNYELPQHI